MSTEGRERGPAHPTASTDSKRPIAAAIRGAGDDSPIGSRAIKAPKNGRTRVREFCEDRRPRRQRAPIARSERLENCPDRFRLSNALRGHHRFGDEAAMADGMIA